jgi:hypothetical protein
MAIVMVIMGNGLGPGSGTGRQISGFLPRISCFWIPDPANRKPETRNP